MQQFDDLASQTPKVMLSHTQDNFNAGTPTKSISPIGGQQLQEQQDFKKYIGLMMEKQNAVSGGHACHPNAQHPLSNRNSQARNKAQKPDLRTQSEQYAVRGA